MTRDLRRYASQTQFRLLVGGILIMLVVGDGLIYWMYGAQSAIMGLLCLLAGLSPLLLIWMALSGIDWIVRRANDR